MITSHCDYRGEESVVWIVSGGLSGAQLLATINNVSLIEQTLVNIKQCWRMKIICEQSVECPDESYWSYAYDSGHLCVRWGGETRETEKQ